MKKQVSIYLTAKQIKKLKIRAAKEGTNVTAIVAELVDGLK